MSASVIYIIISVTNLSRSNLCLGVCMFVCMFEHCSCASESNAYIDINVPDNDLPVLDLKHLRVVDEVHHGPVGGPNIVNSHDNRTISLLFKISLHYQS